MKRINVAYGYCPECLHPMYWVENAATTNEFHDDECSRESTPTPCRNESEMEHIAELLYLFIRPNIN